MFCTKTVFLNEPFFLIDNKFVINFILSFIIKVYTYLLFIDIISYFVEV